MLWGAAPPGNTNQRLGLPALTQASGILGIFAKGHTLHLQGPAPGLPQSQKDQHSRFTLITQPAHTFSYKFLSSAPHTQKAAGQFWEDLATRRGTPTLSLPGPSCLSAKAAKQGMNVPLFLMPHPLVPRRQKKGTILPPVRQGLGHYYAASHLILPRTLHG